MASSNLYDLLDERVIPVGWAPGVPADKRPPAVGLRELFLRAHEITAVTVSLPPALSALYRVLYALTARFTELDHARDWSDRRQALVQEGHFDADRVGKYFARYPDRFRLYDPCFPFLQDARLAEQCDKPAGVNKLVITRPSGRNHSWFGHALDARPEPLPSAEALLHLLVWRYYGPSGRCSAREVNGRRSAQATAGPLRGALSYHPEGSTLFATLLAGLPMPKVGIDPAEDLCPWEWNEPPAPDKAPKVIRGSCSGLTARSQHALLLVPDEAGATVQDAYITWAFLDKMQRADDYLIWQISKEGYPYPRPADSGRALWRDLDALLLEEPEGSSRPHRPEVFRTALELAELLPEGLRVRALGFEQDSQAKDTQLVSASTPDLIALISDTDNPVVAREIGRLRVAGEMAGFRLNTAAKNAWKLYTNAKKAVDCGWSREAAARYWPAAEREFWRRLREHDFQDAAREFRRIAEGVYNHVTYTAAGTTRGARVREAARLDLYGGKPKAPAKSARKTVPAGPQTEDK
ncbi:type I-E CRISPR-associated protein Cse1/CasA [Streptomyces sp. NPDC002676]